MSVVVPKGRTRATLGRRGRPPGPVVVTVMCPACGERHATTDTADERALRILRASALDELAAALRAGADDEHVTDVLAVVERCDARLAGDG